MMQFHWPGFDALRKLSPEEATEFAARVAELTKAGLPLGAGLRRWPTSCPAGGCRECCATWPTAWTPATICCAPWNRGGEPPAQLRGLMLAGVRSGRLAEVLEEYVDLQHSQSELRRRVRMALAYPFILLLFMAVIAVFANVYVVDAFARIFMDFGTELPVMTMLAIHGIAAGDVVFRRSCRSVGAGSALALAGAAIGWLWPMLYRLPMVGPLLRWSHLAQFARLMGLLMEQQVPLPDALRLTAAGLRDANLARGCCRAADDTENGPSAGREPGRTAAVPGQLDSHDPVGPAGAGLARRLPCGCRDVRGARRVRKARCWKPCCCRSCFWRS